MILERLAWVYVCVSSMHDGEFTSLCQGSPSGYTTAMPPNYPYRLAEGTSCTADILTTAADVQDGL